MTTTTTTTKTITRGIVDALYDEWVRLQNRATTYDAAIAEPHASEVKAAHLAYLRAETAYTGLSNDGLIILLYGKEALIETPQPAPVETPVQTPVKTPAPAKPAVERIRGTVAYWNGHRGSIAYEGGFDTQWFTRILGGVTPCKGMVVEFEFAGETWGASAVKVVAVGNAKSEAAYQEVLAGAKKAAPRQTPRPRRNWDMNAQVQRQTEGQYPVQQLKVEG
jgi:hypothetical protein